MTDRLYSVMHTRSAETVARMLDVLFPDAETVLDATYGSGNFWRGAPRRHVVGLDRDVARARDVVGDFTALPFRDGAFDVVIYDPPYIAHPGKGAPGLTATRFGGYRDDAEARRTVMAGAREAWRVARVGLVAKVQQHTHGQVFVDMVGWVREALDGHPLYGQVEQVRPSKLTDPKWADQLSVWSISATFLAFRRGDQRHVRRTALRRAG